LNHTLDSYVQALVKPQLCEECGKEFKSKKRHPHQQFCSNQCRSKGYYRLNIELEREKKRKRAINNRRINRKTLMKYLDGIICSNCDCKSYKILEFHHISRENGIDDKKRFINNATMILYYIKHPEEAKQKLQVLCKPCHNKTRWKYGN
jgi:endogenous inhibitor of DNA gyrase (YacG/DUF329 family)